MPSMYIHAAEVWKAVEGLHVKVSGTWKEVQTGYVKVSGAWKEFYAAVSVALSGEIGINAIVPQPGTAYAGVRINTDGTVDKRINTNFTQIDTATDWIIPNSAASSDYEVYCTDNNSNLAGGSSATGTWLAMSAAREWLISHDGATPKQLDITIAIRFSGGATIDSGNYTGAASAEA